MKKYISLLVAMALVVVFTSSEKKPVTLFLVGDSTMADKTELEISPERGWGQLLPSYLLKDGSIIVENHAKNGRSTKSFIDQGRWNDVISKVSKGDIVVIEFGHNDEKKADSTRYTSIADYRTNLLMMVNDVKKKHATPILATPCCRRYFKGDGSFRSGHHGGYPEAVRQVAKYADVALIDMEKMTEDWLAAAGKKDSKKYFMHVAAGEAPKFPRGKIDNTHFRESGALHVAQLFVQAVSNQQVKPLVDYLDLNSTDIVYTTPVEGLK